MNKWVSILLGIFLVLLGGLSLLFTLAVTVLGPGVWHLIAWQFGALFITSLGLCLVLPPLVARDQRALGVLYIPGTPILAVGTLLFLAGAFAGWNAWAWLWPLIVLALALGFLFAAIYARLTWLVVPAIIVGLNGLMLQFCAVTDWWESWAVLWPIEPLAVGLSLLAVGALNRQAILAVIGLAVCGLAGMSLVMMILVLSGQWFSGLPFGVLGSAILTLAGLALLAWGLVTRRPHPAEGHVEAACE